MIGLSLALFVHDQLRPGPRAQDLNDNPLNSRKIVRDFDRPRGQIISGDGAVLANSVPRLRRPVPVPASIPRGRPLRHITALQLQPRCRRRRAGLQRRAAARRCRRSTRRRRPVRRPRQQVGDVTLTVRRDLQQAAREALGDRKGSIVMERRGGSILRCGASRRTTPTRCRLTMAGCAASKALLEANLDQPLRGRTWQERFFPGRRSRS